MHTGIRVKDAMTRSPIEVSQDISIYECAKLMKEKDIGSVLVKKGKELTGILTEEDLVYKVVAEAKNVKKTKVKDIMVTRLIVIEPNKDIYNALIKMSNNNIRRLPVVEKNKLVGILTMKDILKIEPELFEIIANRYILREEESKPIADFEKQDICQICGELSENLEEKDGILICSKCKKEV